MLMNTQMSEKLQLTTCSWSEAKGSIPSVPPASLCQMHFMSCLTLSNCLYCHAVCACVQYVWIFLCLCVCVWLRWCLQSLPQVCGVHFFLSVITCVLVLELGKWCAENEPGVGEPTWGYQGYQIESSPQTWLIYIIWWYHSHRLTARVMNGSRRR